MADSQSKKVEQGPCAICEVMSNLQCQGCKVMGDNAPFYCGKEHQLRHWKEGHKTQCYSKKKMDDYGGGWREVVGDEITQKVNYGLPYYVATENLTTGRTLFVKKPLMVLPAIPTTQDEMQMSPMLGPAETGKYYPWEANEPKIWSCFSCCEMIIYGLNIKEIQKGNRTRKSKCLKCGWPVHSNPIVGEEPTKCEKIHEEECKILVASSQTWDNIPAAAKGPVGQERSDLTCNFISLIRALLLPSELKEKLLKLPVTLPDRHFNPKEVPFIQKCVNFAHDTCNLGHLATPEEMNRMFRIIISNKITPRFYETMNKRVVSLIMQDGPTGRILSHDCTPNCEMYVDPKTFKTTFKTIRNVRKGDVLTMNYLLFGYIKPVHERHIGLTQLFVPNCSCERCMTPTEGHTYFSAIKYRPNKKKEAECTQDTCQYLMPFRTTAASIFSAFRWNIFCPNCKGKNSSDTWSQEKVTRFCAGILDQIHQATSALDYDRLKRIIAQNSGKTVHPYNFTMFTAAINLALTAINVTKRMEMYDVPNSDHAEFKLHHKFLKDMDDTLEFWERVQPGRWQTIGLTLFFRTMFAISELAEDISDEENVSIEIIDERLEAICMDIDESWLILKESTTFRPFDINNEIVLRKIFSNRLIDVIAKKGIGEQLKNFPGFCNDLKFLPKETAYPSIMLVKEENLNPGFCPCQFSDAFNAFNLT